VARASIWLAPAGLAVFTFLMGGLLGLSLVKFGNPVILDDQVQPPRTFFEFLFSAWPVRWGYAALMSLLVVGLPLADPKIRIPRKVLVLPLCWLGWQLLAAVGTVDGRLTRITVLHFTSCLACFYLGVYCLGRRARLGLFWIPLLLAFTWVLWMGFDQHYGGLEATRKMVYEAGDISRYPPEYLKRLMSQRIFSTLFYPNSLAGVILLLSPGLLVVSWRATARLANVTRGVIAGLLGYASLACLYWSGSKAGWLIAAGLLGIFLIHRPASRRLRVAWAGLVVALALGGFALRFTGYFQHGATSAVARRDYWQAAWTTAIRNPVLGTGPGTFAIPYKQLKRPESEMSRLVHNDYLQQASDSGFVGFLAYGGFIASCLVGLYSRCRADPLHFCVWLGLTGWAAQSLFEFGLYIPALSWVPFALMGWLWGTRDNNRIDSLPAGV
jgi:O-antigen ligase